MVILNNRTHKNVGNMNAMKTIAWFAAVVFFCSIAPSQSFGRTGNAFEAIKLPAGTPNPQNIRQYRLKSNGLDVILCERHATPIVTTMVVYHIGSRNEAVGYTGSTHFLEHMMFKGTQKHDPLKKTGFDDTLKPLGGYNNATTSQDRTNYFEIVPAKSLPVTLEIESDRMQHLLLRPADRASEMTVVRNELERGEDDSREILENNTFASAFKEHPYHHPVIGWRSDVEGVPTERLKQFYKDFYYPNNATLILVGDFKTEPTLALIEKYFASIPRAPKPFPKVYTTEPPQEGERRYTVKRGSESPKLMVAYHSPNALNKDQYALTIIENLLGDESKRSSRLYKRLIDASIASDFNTSNYQMHDPGLFSVTAAAAPNVALEKVEKETIKEIERLKTEAVPIDELNLAKQAIVKRLKLEASDPIGLADQLTEVIASSNLNWWLNFSRNIEQVSQADILRVANKYFKEDNRTVGYYIPKTPAAPEAVSTSQPDTAADSQSETTTDSHLTPSAVPLKTAQKIRPADVSAAIPSTFAARVKKQVLPNGLTVVVLPTPGTGTVAVSGKIQAGTIFRDLEKSQVPEFVADMLTKGSESFSKEEVAKRLEEMGTNLAFGEDDFWVSFDTEVITEDYPSIISLAADCIRKPKFLSVELGKTKKQKHSILNDRISSTSDQSWNAFTRSLYKPSSVYYDKTFEEQINELDKMNVDDLRAYHQAHYIPSNTVLTVVGDINPDDAISTITKQFQDWSGGPRQPIKLSQSDLLSTKPKHLSVPLPDKANVDVVMGRPVPISVQSKDYPATSVGNAAFGYDSFACRLAPVRDQYGLTYAINSYLAGPAEKFAPWAISFSVNPENYGKTVSLVSRLLSEYVKGGITPQELASEKSHLAGVFYVGMRSAKQIAARLCEYEMLGVGAQYMDTYARSINATTLEEVNAAIRKYFQPDQLTVSASGSFKPTDQKK
ncbi:MAG: insulinase family protein [Candidatus Melainabacteria bacterium]|nr:MAG: insulinase family protein [Candidatus Melainabacteria bacterium]